MTDPAAAIADTRRWIEAVVIGLNLCPFARRPFDNNQIRFVVSDATRPAGLEADLRRELEALAAAPAGEVETTLLIHPHVLTDFFDYNDFLDTADGLIEELDLEGVIQIASFHPNYQFAGTAPDAVENSTNRSPYPMLHLLREASVERAVESLADPDEVPRRNVETMRRLGREGVLRLLRGDAG
ncbi:MAG TPA: DUF1415 domain-containing protein [Gemmataceae bacterium]|jgi:hypothetical protein|nr:DUF1415 domain-containing protein [Gemmataceae bacterium]